MSDLPRQWWRRLREAPLFAGIGDEDLQVFVRGAELEDFAPGDTVYGLDEVADAVGVLLEGSVEVFLPGSQVPVRRLEPVCVLGELAMLTGGRRTARVSARTPVTLARFEQERFLAILRLCPEAAIALLRGTAQRLVEAERRARGAG